jgi:acetyl esterase/lipase
MVNMSLRATIVKRLIGLQLSGWSEGTVEEQRANLSKVSRYARVPADVRCQRVSAQGVAAEWIEAPDAGEGVLLYLHGGAYALGSIDSHRELVARLARAARVRGLAIDYRLAPEHPFPAALDDAASAYRWLLAQGFDPSRIIVAGDSAGGGLALATLVALRDAGQRLPAGAVCLSPWTDLALSGESIQGKAHLDPLLSPESTERYARWYARDHERTHPLISPLYADLKGLPPLLIQAATDEILLDDGTRFAEAARRAGVEVTLSIWDGMFHVFQIVSFLPETKEAVAQIAHFSAQVLGRTESA